MEPDDSYFMALESYSKIVELMCGVRSKFVEQGWHPAHAEIATIELVLGKPLSK